MKQCVRKAEESLSSKDDVYMTIVGATIGKLAYCQKDSIK